MKSPRYRSIHISKADLATELLMRGQVRRYLRAWYPDIPNPKGQDWLFANSDIPCAVCPADFRHVRVPGISLPALLVCPACGIVSEHIEVG